MPSTRHYHRDEFGSVSDKEAAHIFDQNADEYMRQQAELLAMYLPKFGPVAAKELLVKLSAHIVEYELKHELERLR